MALLRARRNVTLEPQMEDKETVVPRDVELFEVVVDAKSRPINA